MEQRDYFLLVARMACTALAVASFVIAPLPSVDAPFSGVFLSVKLTNFFELLWGPGVLAVHVCSLRQWLQIPPRVYFCYGLVILQWILTFTTVGMASAAFGIITGEYFRQDCGVPAYRAICRGYEVSSLLTFLCGSLHIAVALVLNWARLTNGPRALEILAPPPQ